MSVSFWGLAQLGFTVERNRHVGNRPGKIPSRINKHTLPPDDQLLCFDLVYYVGAYEVSEYESEMYFADFRTVN